MTCSPRLIARNPDCVSYHIGRLPEFPPNRTSWPRGHEIDGLRELGRIWEGQRRQDYNIDLWPAIHDSLGRPKPDRHWFAMLVVLLVIFKLADLVRDTSLGLWVQVVPVLIAATAFAALRQNPFRIQTDLAVREAELSTNLIATRIPTQYSGRSMRSLPRH
ncbi:MAG: hypothetical protein JO108_35705 [Acidobacteriaceae bacterium]|nr:hypothetical protein [Acidobacteriaceae bacterium]